MNTEQTEQTCKHGYMYCRECLDAANKQEQETALSKVIDVCYGYSYAACEVQYPRLTMEQNAIAKYCTIAGWLTALSLTEHRLLALKLAKDLHDNLQDLADYGGDLAVDRHGNAVDEGSAEHVTNVQNYRIVLHDDGLFGCFGLCWYRYISPATARDWPGRNVNDKLTKEHYFVAPGFVFVTEPCSFTQRYAYAMSGALLYRGPGGGEVFSVSIGDHQGWSRHT